MVSWITILLTIILTSLQVQHHSVSALENSSVTSEDIDPKPCVRLAPAN